MQSQEKIIKCYNEAADDYIVEFGAELSKKPFDRMLLKEYASANKNKGPFADFGCGPGHITKFLYDNGLKDIVGVDVSPGMVDKARKLFPKIKYETGDLLNLSYNSNHYGGAISFYAIVHFTNEQIKRAFDEVSRVMKQGGQFLFSFHAGDETIHYDKFLGKGADIDFYFFQTDNIIQLLPHAGFHVIDVLERYPYKDVEYPSKRAYIWAEKK